MPEDTDLQRARSGDRAALERLLREHHDRIYAVCRRITGNAADAADASQEALIAVVRGLPAFDGRSSLSTWMYRIATNAALDELRRRGRRATPTDRELDHHGDEPLLADRVIDRLELDQALAELPEDFRIPVVLRDVAGLSYAEIEDVLSLPGGTVRSRISRGRAALAARLIGNQGASPERRSEQP